MKKSSQHGMITLYLALFVIYKDGVIIYDDEIHYADSAKEVGLMVKLDKGEVYQYAAAMDDVFLVEED